MIGPDFNIIEVQEVHPNNHKGSISSVINPKFID